MDFFIRHNEAIPILRKVFSNSSHRFSKIVSTHKPFGLRSNFRVYSKEEIPSYIPLYKRQEKVLVDKKYITKNRDWISQVKVLIAKAYGGGKTIPNSVTANHSLLKIILVVPKPIWLSVHVKTTYKLKTF